LRKSYASNLANAGTPVHTLMKLMGHSSIVTTQKYYLHSSDENEKKAVEELEKMSVGGS
jgi:integrase